MARKVRRCAGYPPHDDCESIAGATHSPYWCQRCDELRRAAITRSLEEIARSMGIDVEEEGTAMSDLHIYYFGCHQKPGHFLWKPGMWDAGRERARVPFRDLDGALCIGSGRRVSDGRPSVPHYQPEGEAILHYKGGWTALAFWDRSVDGRPGSNSVFLAETIEGGEAMIALAQGAFPDVWARFPFEVRIIFTHDHDAERG